MVLSSSHPFGAKETPLIDRVEEMGLLKEASDTAIRGRGNVFFLYGEAGIGKTRLTRELRTYTHSHGMQILYGRCSALVRLDSVPPYALWKEIIRDYLQVCTPEQLQNAVGYYPGEIYKIVPEIKQRLAAFQESPKLSPELERDRLFEAVSQFVENISKTTPLVVVLDDLQWCDASSLLLMHYLARGVYRDSLLLLGTYRDVEVEEKHPLFPVLTDLKRAQLLQSARLKRFSLDEVTEMIKRFLWQDDVPSEFCKLIYEKTRGNPFFVEEVMQSLKEEGIVYPYGAEYRFKEISKIEFPETVRSVLQERIGRLDEETQQVLTMASFIGNDFSLEALRNVTGLEEKRLIEIVENMITKRLLTCRVVRGDETCSFSDVLVRDVLYESVGPLKRKRLHGVVAFALEKAYAKDIDEHLGDIAAHFLEGGDQAKALDYFLRAGEKAAKVYANREASSYFESALSLLEEKGGELQERARVLEALGDVKSLVGEYDACLKCWDEARLLWQKMQDKQKIARLHRKSSTVLMHKMGNPQKAKEHQLKALEILEAEPESAELANLRSEMAHLYWHIGEMATAMPLAERAVETANRLNDSEAKANSYLVLGKLARFQGDTKRSTENYDKALKIALEKGYTEIALSAYAGAGPSLDEQRVNEAPVDCLQEAYEMAKKAGAISQQSWIGNGLSGRYLGIGNTDMALKLAEESAALDRKMGNLHNLPRSLGSLGNVYQTWGEWENAERCFTEALSISEKHNMATSTAMSYYQLGTLHLVKEDFAKAREFFEKATDLFRKSGVRFGEAAMFVGVVATSIELGELEKAENQVSFLEMVAQKTNNASVRAFADVMKAKLLRAQKKYNESISYYEKSLQELQATMISNQRVGWFARHFLCGYAGVYLERDEAGDRERARNLLNQALEIYRKMKAKKDIEKIETMLLNIEKGLPLTWETKTAGFVATGFMALDRLLYGGIRTGLSVALASPSCDERDALVKSFLETGAKKGEPTFYLANDPGLAGFLVEEFPSNFYLFVGNPQAEAAMKSAPNFFTLKGMENLTNFNIALIQAIRKLDPSPKNPRRMCIGFLSDLLLQHGPLQIRKWLTELLTQLRSAGFTTLAMIDPMMHPPEQLHAILSMFDGEVSIREAETDKGTTRFLKVKRMSGQKFLKDEICLTEE